MQASSLASNRINLKLLQTFMLVAENSSFREAADQVNRSQSAVSMQIKQLEEQMGVSLFHRTTRAVKLTPEGRQLLDSARRAVGELELGLRNMQELADVRRGRVTIACAPTIAATRLPPILAAFETEYPTINMVLKELKSAELYQTVRNGEVDFAIGPVINDGDFSFEPIIAERIHALVPNRLIAKRRSTISLTELAELPIIQFHKSTVMGQLIAEAAKSLSLNLNVRYQCLQGQTMVALAEAGLGATILTESAAMATQSDAVQKMLIVEPSITQHFAIVHLRGRTLTPAASRLAELVRNVIKGDAAAGRPKRRMSRKSE